jgi:hypothetical protein
VVRAYVHTLLADQDTAAAALLTCREPHVEVFTQWQQDLAATTARYGPAPLRADVVAYTDRVSGSQAHAVVDVAVSVMVDGRARERITRPIDITLVHAKTWTVCAAHQSPSR